MFVKFGRIETFAAIPLPSAFRASAHSRHRRSQAKQVAVDAEAADLTLRDSCHDRVMAKLLAGVDVRHVHLDDRRRENRKRVPDAVAVVRPGAGVDEHGVDLVGEAFVDALAHRGFAVGLEALDRHPELLAERLQLSVDLGQRDRPVVSGIALAEHVEVDTVEHENLHGCASFIRMVSRRIRERVSACTPRHQARNCALIARIRAIIAHLRPQNNVLSFLISLRFQKGRGYEDEQDKTGAGRTGVNSARRRDGADPAHLQRWAPRRYRCSRKQHARRIPGGKDSTSRRTPSVWLQPKLRNQLPRNSSRSSMLLSGVPVKRWPSSKPTTRRASTGSARRWPGQLRTSGHSRAWSRWGSPKAASATPRAAWASA